MKLPRPAPIVRPDRSETGPPNGFEAIPSPLQMTVRRFPPPWTVEDHNRACFIVKDRGGHALAYVYFEEEPGRQAAANLMTKDEARRIAANIAKLPALLVRPQY
jgi:hypothetical protein